LRLAEQLASPNTSPFSFLPDEQATLLAQVETGCEVAQQLFNCQARAWLANRIIPDADLLASQATHIEPMLHNWPNTDLLRLVAESRELCGEGQGQVQIIHPDDSVPNGISSLAAPLLSTSEGTGWLLGLLQIWRPVQQSFSHEEIDLFHSLTRQVSIALQASRQKIRARWRVEQLSLVGKVSAQITGERDLDQLAARVTQLILQTFGYYYVAIFTLEPGRDLLNFRASAGPQVFPGLSSASQEQQARSPEVNVHTGEGIIGQVALTGQEILANDVNHEPRYRFFMQLPETLSEFTLPLKIEERVLGILDVQSNLVDDFDEIDILVLRALADNIAAAVEGVRLYNSLNRRAEQLTTLFEVSNTIASVLDPDSLLHDVAWLIQRNLGHPYIHLFTVHHGLRKVLYEAGSLPESIRYHAEGVSLELDAPAGIIPWVARNGETILANTPQDDPRFSPSPIPPQNPGSELAVPLKFGENVLGVLDVQSDQPDAFTTDDRFILEALADHIAIALRNASLYRSERWRRQAADSLHQVAGLLSAETDLNQLLNAVLSELSRNLPCDLAGVWLLDQDEIEDGPIPSPLPLRLMAYKGQGLEEMGIEPGLSPDDVMCCRVDDECCQPEQEVAAWLAAVAHTEQAMVRSPDDPSDPLALVLRLPGNYSAISAPLRIGKQMLGILTLAHRTPGRYGSEAVAMTTTFANYAAIAIQNTRLYEDAHEQAWVSTALLQVAEATYSATDLEELLTTVTRIMPMLVGVKSCTLYMLDEDGNFVPTASSGLQPGQRAEFERWRYAPGEVPALDRLLLQKQPVILHDEPDDLRLSGFLYVEAEPECLFQEALLVLIPLLVRGEPIGAFLVEYGGSQSAASPGSRLETLIDERLSISQGIAQQTAIAVENLRLIKSQKEEAYISVALLQVAQAIVSTNDLEDILGTVVRITPILVGVKRSMIFLWNENQNTFQLNQGYGIMRQLEGKEFSPQDTPWLDTVRQEGRLVVFPTEDAPDNPEDMSTLFNRKWSPPPEMVDTFIREAPCLMIALPLSVKGETLGVLVVEEPAQTLSPGAEGRSSNRRLRSKRLEIITGISQQTALAIQNNRLQHERVLTERLERELQLAREIQLAFLPRHLPELPGWELAARWHTAREVGGDFYDVIELSPDRVGIVIADVADKGMPAALFMTLTRTLVRAAAHEFTSPGMTLTRVNDTLVSDTQQGAFVTVFYGVLECKTGKLHYANAGHNPPLLFYRSGGIERLTRTGVALGILEDNPVSEHTIQMDPGDYLILYTDGVTETFSPDGRIFGENRLQMALTAEISEGRNATTAASLLDGVEARLEEFSGRATPDDDLTLVALTRL
jgi:GAF domain-containing protein